MFKALRKYQKKHRDRHILKLFDQGRFEDFSVTAGDLFIDYSKTQIDMISREMMLAFAGIRGVAAQRDAMFNGTHINDTEDRAVLHTALRAPKGTIIQCDGVDVVAPVHAVLEKMEALTSGIYSGEITASDGGKFSDVVNIGIGGSDLGPAMAYEALKPYHQGLRCHFVSNIDSAHIADVLKNLDPNRTLILIASKTFTTIETMTNAQTAKAWLSSVANPAAHLVAISTALEKTKAFGVPEDRVFGFEDWVGGRYSVWGPIGLSVQLAIGNENFRAFLSGGHLMDRHFAAASEKNNGPLMLGLIGLWHRNVMGYPTRAILPYEQRLLRLPAYFQQLDMESNGKSVRKDGKKAKMTGPIVWGEPGTNGQHAFYQLIHQGTDVIPCEFLVAKECHEPELAHQHNLLKANCLAQSRALLIGRSLAEARKLMETRGYSGDELERQARHRVFPGNRPSVTITYPKLTPSVLGQIIALYEHRVFVEGALWGINSYDQWGVELGKELAASLAPAFKGEKIEDLDGSSDGLLKLLT